MENPRSEKVAVVDEVKAKLEASDGVVLTEYRGIDVPTMAELRKAVTDAGAEYKIYKNTLVRFAAESLGLDFGDLLTGPTAIGFAMKDANGNPGDPVALAKALADFSKSNDLLVLKGGVLDGEILDVDAIKLLAKTPPRDQLYAEFVGAGESFYQDFAGLLENKLREFVYAMEELADKGVLAEGVPAEEPAADEPVAEEPAAEEPVAEETEAATDEVVAEETDVVADEAAAEVADESAAPESNDEAADVAAEETDPADSGDTETADGGEDQEGA
jgi:large subunit ribosomal protein L10